MKKMALHWQVIIALIIGVIYSIIAVQQGWAGFTADYVAPFGEIFIRVLKLIAVPMVLFSIISGIGSLKNIKQLGRVGIKTLLIYMTTTMSAIIIGLLLVNLIKPGTFPSDNSRLEKRIEYELWLENNSNVTRLDDVHIIQVPENFELANQIRGRMAMEKISPEVQDKLDKAAAKKSSGPLAPLVDIFPPNILYAMSGDGGKSNMLQVIFFAMFFGVILVQLPKKHSKPVDKLINGLNEVFIGMINAVINVMPIFVFALMAGSLVKSAGQNLDKLKDQLMFLGHYSWVVLLALVLVAFVFYPTLITLFAKGLNPKKFLKGISKAQLTAFSTSSSMATLPVTMDCVHDNLDVPKSISSFVLPIGATVNMDGTSLYQAVAVVALAQFHMIDLDFTQQMVIVLTATLASIGAAAVPSAGLVLMIVVLESVGLNPAWIAIILPVDRILDMCRTVVNVTGDATVASIVSATEERSIKEEESF
ncbi:dicarboxylate/amino acid:cation symporter [Bacteroidia bacterium]|nr:dicarboxylate/amino acid:cation symporter [Bacteroidia bacterium]MDB4107237.1 dicarboxylate/amino acid:cation symporter [Bacteroidia bacterium]MDB9883152.1 dicarboxylate/amino acid:cation symporter [Bacteroidia bacterium]